MYINVFDWIQKVYGKMFQIEMENIKNKPRSPVSSPRLPTDSNGKPDVKPILREAARSPAVSGERKPVLSPRNPHVYSATPIRSSRSPSPSPRVIQRSGGPALQKRIAPPVQTIPTVIPANTNEEISSEAAKAQRDLRRKIERDDFDDVEMKAPPIEKPTKSHLGVPSVQEQIQTKVNRELDMIAREVPIGSVARRVGNATYIMPDYKTYTKIELENEQIYLRQAIKNLSANWKSKGCDFEMPKEGEDVSSLQIRLQNYRTLAKRKSGASLWWLVLAGFWGGIEYVTTQILHLKMDGFMCTQLKNYKIYEMQLIEMGEGSGFGQDWPPWLQTAVTTALAGAVFVGFGFWVDNPGEYAGEAIKLISSIVTGEEIVELDEDGNPLPPKDSMVDKLSKMMDSVDMENMSLSKGIKMIKMFSGGFGGGGGTKKAPAATAKPKSGKMSKEDRKKAKAAKRKQAIGSDDD